MEGIDFWVFFISIILLLQTTTSAVEDEKQSLLIFYQRLSNGIRPIDPNFGWNDSSDPCFNSWSGIKCRPGSSVTKVVLEDLGLNGILDANSICSLKSLMVLSIQNNSIHGEIPAELANCRQLTHLYLNDNQFSGSLPASLSRLNKLKRLFLSTNNFSGELPDFTRISGLISFLAQNNHFSGQIPAFNFTKLQEFNVSSNNLSGPVPDLHGYFDVSSLSGNPALCGKPLPTECPPSPPPRKQSKGRSTKRIIMVLGYVLLALVLVGFVIYKTIHRKKTRKSQNGSTKRAKEARSRSKSSSDNSEHKTGGSRSEYSLPSSNGSGMMPSSLIVLSNSRTMDLTFERLLKSPAELLGRGRYGSLYKVEFEVGIALAVKRIKGWTISSAEFRMRMENVYEVKHPNVLPALAFYCSIQEKLVVYEYQQNGSLFNLLHGTQNGYKFDWGSRLRAAASIAEGLDFMHKSLSGDGIAHGNLKSSNIVINNNMDPCISEYGLVAIDNEAFSSASRTNSDNSRVSSPGSPNYLFKADIYKFGVILLELLTGKMVQNNGFDLASWVHSVVREEWTVEVFDKALISEGASEERMVNLLHVALKCINSSPESRPSTHQVVTMISSITEEEERSIVSEAS